MRCDMLMDNLKYERTCHLWWMMFTKEANKVKWMRHEHMHICGVSNMKEFVICDKWWLTREASKKKVNDTWIYAR